MRSSLHWRGVEGHSERAAFLGASLAFLGRRASSGALRRAECCFHAEFGVECGERG